MSNPFDQFSAELSSALPPAGAPSGNANPFGAPMAPAENKPVMNAPAPAYGGGYGAPMGMGQQPPQQQQPMYGGAPPMNGSDPFAAYGAPAPTPAAAAAPPASDPYASQNPYAAAPAAMPPQAPPSAPPTPNPYGAPAPLPAWGAQPQAPPTPNTYGAPPPQDPYAGYGAPPPAAAAAAPAAPPSQDPFAAYGAPAPTPVAPGPAPGPAPGGAATGGADPFAAYGAPPAPAAQPPASDPYAGYGGANPYGAPAAQPPAADAFGGYGAPAPPPAPANDPYAGYGAPASQPPANDPYAGYGAPAPAAPAPANDPYAGYGAPAPPAALPPSQDPFASYGGGGGGGATAAAGAPAPGYGGYGDPNMGGALVVSQQQSNPYAMPPQQQPPQGGGVDPFSVFNSAPTPAPAPPQPYPGQGAMVPAQAPQQPPPQQQPPAPAQGGGGDLWGDLGFDAPPSQASVQNSERNVQEEKKDSGDLPPGGEFYDARIFTPTLGVMFFKPQELTDSLFLNTDRELVDGLGERPVVAFIVEGSSARSAGVELGHVLLKVNGVDVKNPKEASRLIKEGPRPLPLLFYVPSTEVVVAEGEHMVKYDTRETTAPNSAKDWKPKYVVIGGIIAQPWMMNMYRSKSEYDIAVIETQARRPVSVKVKQFSLQGARIQNDWQGPQMVKYKNKLHPWKYIVVLPVARNPIKISSPNLAQLKPVHEGIRRVLLAQQRGRGGNSHSAVPSGTNDGYGQRHAPQQEQRALPPSQPAYNQQQQYAPQQGYAQQPPQGQYGY
eukprot:Nitzschia sp. Nitz4//scaffold107_size73032//240//2564//NITZ4_005749-RA/size73032-processed-gene-0.117-mRNA-1//-1//CDS//3329532560//8637//frame0